MFENLPKKVKIVEVGPRDGLQNEQHHVPTSLKAQWIKSLIDCGIDAFEITSFVNKRMVPQMADAADLYPKLADYHKDNVSLTCLVGNKQHMQEALDVGVKEIALFTATSDDFCLKNIHSTVDQSLKKLSDIAQMARENGIKIRGLLSTVFGHKDPSDQDMDRLMVLIDKMLELGSYEISLCDTLGIAGPIIVQQVITEIKKRYCLDKFAMHFHDTRGTALSNILVSLENGIEIFDSSAGGLGGCPFAGGATGNIATEDLINLLDSMGIDSGIDIDKLCHSDRAFLDKIGHQTSSKFLKAWVGSRG